AARRCVRTGRPPQSLRDRGGRVAARWCRRDRGRGGNPKGCIMSPRIVIVGGGSYHWAPRLLCDFANTRSLTGAEVVLHDLDADRLKLMGELGAEIARRRGIGLTTTVE